MASESVATDILDERHHVPGIGDLLPGLREFMVSGPRSADWLTQTHNAAENALETLTYGIRATCSLLWRAVDHEQFPVERDTVRELSDFLEMGAGLALDLHLVSVNAQYYLHEQAIEALKPKVEESAPDYGPEYAEHMARGMEEIRLANEIIERLRKEQKATQPEAVETPE